MFIALGSSLIASALILKRGQALAIGVPLALAAVSILLHIAAHLALPKRPKLATRFIGAEWPGLVGLGALLGGVTLWLAALLPKDVAGAEETGMTVVAVVVGLALIEVLKKLAIDEAIIESAGESEWKRLFRNAYEPLLESGRLARDRTVQTATGQSIVTKTYAWQAIYIGSTHGGFGRKGRASRAADLDDAVVDAGLRSNRQRGIS